MTDANRKGQSFLVASPNGTIVATTEGVTGKRIQKLGLLTLDLVTKTSEEEWDFCTRGQVGFSEQGERSWSVCLGRLAKGVSIGICRADISLDDADANCDKRVDLFGGTGEVVDMTNTTHDCFSRPLRFGDTVQLSLNLDEHTLTFTLNDDEESKSFGNIPSGIWFPYICMRFRHCSATFLPAPLDVEPVAPPVVAQELEGNVQRLEKLLEDTTNAYNLAVTAQKSTLLVQKTIDGISKLLQDLRNEANAIPNHANTATLDVLESIRGRIAK